MTDSQGTIPEFVAEDADVNSKGTQTFIPTISTFTQTDPIITGMSAEIKKMNRTVGRNVGDSSCDLG